MKKELWIGVIIASLFLIFNLLVVNDYSFGRDSDNHLRLAEAHIQFFATGHFEIYGFEPSYGPVFDLIFYSSYWFFHKVTGILDVDTAFHLPVIFVAAGAILIVFLFALEAFNLNVAIISSIFLSLMPRFIGHAHFNVKDIPVLFAFFLSLYLFWKAITINEKKWFIYAGMALGLALTIKPNGFFIPIIILIWFMVLNLPKLKNGIKYFEEKFYPKITLKQILLYFFTAAITMFYIWPGMWCNVVWHFLRYIAFFGIVFRGNLSGLWGICTMQGLTFPGSILMCILLLQSRSQLLLLHS